MHLFIILNFKIYRGWRMGDAGVGTAPQIEDDVPMPETEVPTPLMTSI
jgi:hypothetical protein